MIVSAKNQLWHGKIDPSKIWFTATKIETKLDLGLSSDPRAKKLSNYIEECLSTKTIPLSKAALREACGKAEKSAPHTWQCFDIHENKLVSQYDGETYDTLWAISRPYIYDDWLSFSIPDDKTGLCKLHGPLHMDFSHSRLINFIQGAPEDLKGSILEGSSEIPDRLVLKSRNDKWLGMLAGKDYGK